MARSGSWIGWMAAGSVACAALGAQPGNNERIGITEVAPLESFVVMAVPSWPAARAAMMRSEVGGLWSQPQVQSFVTSMFRDALSDDEEGRGGVWGWFATNVEKEDLREPTGAVGMALFPARVPDPDNAGEQVDRIQGMIIAEFGDDAQVMLTTVGEALERLEREGRITLDEDDHDGVEIRIVHIVQEEEDPEEAALRAQWGEGPDRTMDAFNTMMVAFSQGRMLVCTDRGALERALDRIAGQRLEAVGENRTYRAAMAQHPGEPHATFVAIATEYVRANLLEGMEDAMGMFPMPGMGPMVTDLLGLGAIEGLGMGVRFDTDAGSVEQTIGVLAPRKAGLLTLLDAGLPQFEPPAFVPADAMSAWSVAMRFDRIPELVRGAIRSMPPETQQQILAVFDGTVAPILASLGGEMHVVQTLTRPLGPESAGSVVAIRLKDPLTMSNALNGFAPQMGLAPRVFEGNQLFESEMGGPVLGIGFDHLFIGTAESIENAMRLAARPDTPRLSASDRFRRATAPLGRGAALYYYDNREESLEWSYWSMENAERIFAAQIEEWGLDADTREDFLRDFREGRPAWQKDLPPLRTVLEYIGDSAMELRATPDGFRGRSVLLRPRGR